LTPPQRRKSDVDLTDIKIDIAEIKVHIQRSVPAMEQVWKNKTAIGRMRIIQSLIVWVGGVTGTGFIYTVIREIITKHPPQIPHGP
jgi:hypothetical protein